MASIYTVQTRGQIDGQDCLNSFDYIGAGNDATSELVAQVFKLIILEAIKGIVSSSFVWLEMVVLDWLNPENNINVDLTGENGTRDNEHTPAFVTYSFQLKPAVGGYRSGRKAFSGVADIDIANGFPTASQDGRLETLADALSAQFTVAPSDFLMWPVIYNKPSDKPWVLNPVSIAPFSRISTQNSRKRYTNANSPLSIGGVGSKVVLSELPGITITQSVGGKNIEAWVTEFGSLSAILAPNLPDPLTIPLP